MRIIFYLLLLTLFSCQEKIINNSSDIDTAKNLSDEFYLRIKDENTSAICRNLDESVNEKHFCKLLSIHVTEYGDLKEKNIFSIETVKTGINENGIITYNIMLDVIYQKGKSYETLNFKKENGIIKLVAYYFSPSKYR